MSKPKIGIFGLTGCAGDQLVILNCEDELLDLVGALDIRDFLTASSANDTECLLDIAFVEGAVLSERDRRTLLKIRARSGLLVALGTCAVWGGIAAMDRGKNRGQLLETVFGKHGKQYDTCAAKALQEIVKVDLRITGCPVEKKQVIGAIADLLNGNPPLLPEYAVCTECKMRENNCLLIEKGEICLGPLTVAGCEARCPSLNIPCVGCRGPSADANLPSAVSLFTQKGISLEEAAMKLRTFAPVKLPVDKLETSQ